MDYYQIWFNLKDSHKDMEFVAGLNGYLGALKARSRIADFRLTRRKFGFGPPSLGEFNVTITIENLTQLDSAFDLVAHRTGEIEQLHARVYSAVCDFQSALYRDFPDAQRPLSSGQEARS